MRRAIKPIALAVLSWAAIMFGIGWGLHATSVHPCPSSTTRVITHVMTHTVTHTVYLTRSRPAPVTVVVTPGKHGTLCLSVDGHIIDPIGLQDCWGALDKEYRGKDGRTVDPY